MMDQLRKQKREFASVTESLDTSTAMGRFVMDIIQRIAQLESDQIGERTYTGMAEKARQQEGNLGKPAPFGYAYGPDHVLALVPSEASIVFQVFERFAAGAKRSEIASWLNAQGLRGRGKGGRGAGAAWTAEAVGNLLRNPTYAGALGWEGQLQVGTHPASVPPELFDQVQATLGKSRAREHSYRLQESVPSG